MKKTQVKQNIKEEVKHVLMEQKAKEPYKLSRKDFYAMIKKAPANKYVSIETVDWGSRARGQGKRSGGMAVGAMSDAPIGKKKYGNIFAKLPDYDKIRDEVHGIEITGRAQYTKARDAGFDHDTSLFHAYRGIDAHEIVVQKAIKKKLIKSHPDYPKL